MVDRIPIRATTRFQGVSSTRHVAIHLWCISYKKEALIKKGEEGVILLNTKIPVGITAPTLLPILQSTPNV